MERALRFLLIFLVWSFLSCHHHATNSGNEAWDDFVHNYIEGYYRLNPVQAVNDGRHEYDGQLPDWSRDGISKKTAWFHEQHEAANQFEPAKLTSSQRFEQQYLISRIDAELFWIESAESPYRSPMYYSGGLSPSIYLTREYAPLPQRLRAYIEYAKRVPAAVQQVEHNLRTPLPRSYLQVGKNVFGGLAQYYRSDVAAIFVSVQDDKLQSDFKAANEQAATAMTQLASWLDQQLPNATNDYAIGPDLFSKMLMATEDVDVPLSRLEEIGQKDLERNLTMLKNACASYAPAASVEDCVAKVQAKKPPEGPVPAAQKQLKMLRAFVQQKNLVTIPAPDEANVAEAPPYRRFNTAYIEIPGPFEKGLPSVYYIAPPDPAWTKEEQAAYIPSESELLAISTHEVWPGHFLQYLHAKRSSSKFRQIFVGYAFSEGWAHYAEEMMWDAGLGDGNPEIHIGQILNALLRDVRFISAIGLHTKGMSVEESTKMFREKAFKDPANSMQQAVRGTFDPGYLNYTLGKLMIMKLRDDWTSTRGDRKAWRDFHDAFLSYGGPPIPLVRKALLGENSGPAL